jgi:hypothetical protein
MCLERGRLDWFTELESPDTDATVLGTAVHEYAEQRLHGRTIWESFNHASEWFNARIAADDFVRKQIKGDQTLRDYHRAMCEAWEVNILPEVQAVESVEGSFLVKLAAHPDTPAELWLEGTWDLLAKDDLPLIWDWKTAGRLDLYEGWQIDRWYVQPTTYTAAVAAMRGIDPMTAPSDYEGVFFHGVVTKGKHPHTLIHRTTRGRPDWRFLAKQLWTFVTLYEKIGPHGTTWPLNDQGWWCSEKWCPAWFNCKGSEEVRLGITNRL